MLYLMIDPDKNVPLYKSIVRYCLTSDDIQRFDDGTRLIFRVNNSSSDCTFFEQMIEGTEEPNTIVWSRVDYDVIEPLPD